MQSQPVGDASRGMAGIQQEVTRGISTFNELKGGINAIKDAATNSLKDAGKGILAMPSVPKDLGQEQIEPDFDYLAKRFDSLRKR